MVNIRLHPQFTRSYNKRIRDNVKLAKKVARRVELFQRNPTSPLLKDHALIGKKYSLRAFWITGDIRIVYLPVSKKEVVFLDIGSHNQVY